MKIGIITASDKGFRGERIDLSGPLIAKTMTEYGAEVAFTKILPDELDILATGLIEMCDQGCDVIFTTGGTGFSPRDVTPEATMRVCERMAPGIGEAMRVKSLMITERAMLSRATAGIRGKTLIINLPGSPKACLECLQVVLGSLAHAVEILTGKSGDCAR